MKWPSLFSDYDSTSVYKYTANILTVLSTAFGSVTCATAIWLYILQPKIAIDLKLYSSVSLNVTCTVVDYLDSSFLRCLYGWELHNTFLNYKKL